MLDTTQPNGQAGLKPEQLELLRQRLQEERESITQLYRRDVRAGQKSVEEASEDLVDRANLAYNRELVFSLSDSERQQLRLIDEALERLDKGSYGICQYSGEPIGFERLRVVPWARFRVEYQEMMEQGLLVLDN